MRDWLKYFFILLFCFSSLFSSNQSAIAEEKNQIFTVSENAPISIQKISQPVLYFGAGVLFSSISLLTRLGWEICLISPWSSTFGNECLLLSHLCDSIAKRSFAQTFKKPSLQAVPFSESSWHLNEQHLSQIPTSSDQEKQLVLFLKKHWLAKCTGFFSSIVNWICPSFDVSVQVHPETSSTYARNPWNEFSETYCDRVENWKKLLPHPSSFPLILMRPFDFQNYLPNYLLVTSQESLSTTVEKIALKMQLSEPKVIVDLTQVLPEEKNQKKWLQNWQTFLIPFSQVCKENHLDLNRVICIQRIYQGEMGGIRVLPLAANESEENHRFLLDWISVFGLTANRVELDRFAISSDLQYSKNNAPSLVLKLSSKEELLSSLDSFEKTWKTTHPQKDLMFKATLKILKGFIAQVSEEDWNVLSPTQATIAQLSFLKIKEQFDLLTKKTDEMSFFDAISHLEQIHANLASLLEVFHPFSSEDFGSIYCNVLSIPSELKPFTSCAVHASGMTSIAGIFKALENTLHRPSLILYGENTYFECIKAAKCICEARTIDEASEVDWQQVDLLLAQFNPALKRIELPPTIYKVEKVEDFLHKSLSLRKGNPLTVALDCTLDFLDSPRVTKLLAEFQEEIKSGILNIICYRSGIKFDLFGMDNYAGAPLFMIHNKDAKWSAFDLLSTDSVLQTDPLSLNWFSLAYKNVPLELDLYRKQIFDNTRALLNKVPTRLFAQNSPYRIVPVEKNADIAFLDIKISGPFHGLRGACLGGGSLYIKCMSEGHPIFYRPSLGFYHPNFTMLFAEENTTIRLTLGLEPSQVDVLAKTFEMIDTLNGSPWQATIKKSF